MLLIGLLLIVPGGFFNGWSFGIGVVLVVIGGFAAAKTDCRTQEEIVRNMPEDCG